MHFVCPICRENQFSGHPIDECTCCRMPLKRFCMELPKVRSKFRLVSGTVRKKLPFRKKTLALLLDIQGGCCAYCDMSLDDKQYHIDHVIPLSVGGSNLITNLVISCPKCNLTAGSLVFTDFMAKREYLRKVKNGGQGLKLFTSNVTDILSDNRYK